jgi:ketosteroid isomerase-like protein
MHPNVTLLERFYRGIQDADITAVRACYAPNVVYSDPVFGELRGERAIAMWDMFFAREDPPRVTYGDLAADDLSGSGRWEASYVFSKTGRPVRNAITSQFRFAEHRIVEQRDSFSVHRWAAMALGPVGRLAGWSPPLRWAVHKETVRLLDRHQANANPGAPRGRTEPGRD